MDIFELRDIMVGVDAEVEALLNEVEVEFDSPDYEAAVKQYIMSAPPEAWEMLDDETVNGLNEVLNA